MAARRPVRDCPHGDASTPYPVWADEGWSLGVDAVLDAALHELSAALMACPDPLQSALEQLTAQDVRKGLSATPVAQRPAVLRPLGLMLTPRSIGQQLCRDVLARLTRVDDHEARHASTALTGAMVSDFRSNIFAEEFARRLPAAVRRDPAELWSPALARVAAWSHGVASVGDARLWRWASEQPWFAPDSVTDEHVAAILAAADRVIDASPGYRFLDEVGEATPAADVTLAAPTPDVPQRAGVELESIAGPESTADEGAAEAAPQQCPTDEEELRMRVTDAGRSAATQAQQAGEILQKALAEALPAAQRVLADVTIDRAPDADDLAVLTAARGAFDDAVAALTAAGSDAAPTTGADVASAVATLVSAADDAPVLARLAQLQTLTAPGGNGVLADALATAQQRAATLSATTPWTDADRDRAVTLATVNDLADPTTAPEQAMALQQQLVATHPDLALLAITAAQLTAAQASTPIQDAPAGEATDRVGVPPAGDALDTVISDEAAHVSVEDVEVPVEEDDTISVLNVLAEVVTDAEIVSAPVETARPSAAQIVPDTNAAAPAAAPPPDEAITKEVAAHAHLVDGVASLIRGHRFGLAAAVAETASWNDGQQSALRIAALSDAVRSEAGAVGAALRGELTELDTTEVAEDSPSVLLTVAALLRAALVTGEPTTGAVLTELATRVEPNLADVAEQVGRRALQGALLGAPPLTVLADVTEIERSLRSLSEAAGAMLRPRTLRFKRATDIAKVCMAADGMLGRPLTIAAKDDRAAVNEVTSAIRRLGDTAHIAREIETLDRRFKGASGKPIEGSGRQDLINLVQEAIQNLAAWADAVLSLQRSGTAQTWSTGEIADMRAAVLARRDSVVEALQAQSGHSDPLLAAASHAAAGSLTLTFAVLDGEAALPAREPAPAFALTAELLKVPGAVADTTLGRVTAPADVTVEGLLSAAGRNWHDAVTAQVAAENFDAAEFLLSAAEAHLLPGGGSEEIGPDTAAWVATAKRELVTELTETHERLSAELRRARTNNEVSEEQAGELTGMLRDAEVTGTGHLAAVRARLIGIAELLPIYRAESARRLSERLAALPGVGTTTVERVTRLIDSGELSTAEELIYFLEIGEPVPQVAERHDLQQFFPAVPDALPTGLTAEVIAAARGRGQVPGCDVLDYGRLGGDTAELAAVALDGWRRLATTPPEQRRQISERDLLLPALRMVGIEGRGIRQLDLPRGRDRRFLDIIEVTINGKSLVPAFGSKLDGRVRVLLVWGQPSAELLLSHADQDNADASLLIAYFGTMNAQTRRDLAAHAVAGSRTAPVVVLDDAALAYLAAHGDRQMDATMSLLLPFSNTNPYVSKKRGLVAEEMFYGRDAERKSVLDSDGTQLIYGGRGLGKSALLRSAGALFESQGAPGERVSLYLSLDTLGIRARSAIGPDAIWNALLRDLTDDQVLMPPRRAARGKTPHELVRAGVLAWLDVDSRRRLLILLDESDRFFEADAPEFFETNRLKELGLTTDGRIKVVFAGLHSVQRYAKSARNGPFSHLAQRPTVIGPLRPQFATNLLTRPLQALGYRFADDDLVNRVLGYCSYQPFLLQMFGSRLVATMHAQRAATTGRPASAPPYVITRDDVVAVESDVELKADISAAFHDTLNLDPRYNVIANVLAHHAHEAGIDARMSDVELREECLAWWPKGFTSLDVEGFRAYLHEMVGLGVLAPNNDGRGWHLRSPNVLHMIGSKDAVTTELVGAAILSVPDEFIALESRLELEDGRRSPLTAGQTDDVLGDHANQVRVVLGSQATGIGDVAAAVRYAADIGDRFTVPVIAIRRQFEEELVGGRPGERRVVLSDLFNRDLGEEACAEALSLAVKQRPAQAGVTRSAVLVAGPQQLSLWRTVLGDHGRTAALGTVTLRRYDQQTLRVWALESQKFSAPERLERLLAVTGGWPMLVERAGQLVADGETDESGALDTVAAELGSPSGAADFIDAVGLTADEDLVKAFAAVLSLVDSAGVTFAELGVAASMAVDEADTVVACLQALGVFDVDAAGKYRPEPLLVRAWPHRA